MKGYVPPHFAGPLRAWFMSCQVTLHERMRNHLCVHTSFGNFLEFEVTPHMLKDHDRIVVRYHTPKTRKIHYVRTLYVKHDSPGEVQAFNECLYLISSIQKRDAILWNYVLHKLTVLFYVLCSCKGARCVNKDVRKQIVTLVQDALFRRTVMDECTVCPLTK